MPGLVDGDRLRAVMRHVASPVTVVTFATSDGPRGVTIGSFASLSLDPPLISFNLSKDSSVYELLTNASSFCVHILNDTQAPLSDHFARPDQPSKDQFEEMAYALRDDGVPILEEVLAVLYCSRHALFEAGDHAILIGEVVEASVAEEGGPMLYYNRSYRGVGRAV